MTQDIVIKGKDFEFTIKEDKITAPLDPSLYDNLSDLAARSLVMQLIGEHHRLGINVEDEKYIEGLDSLMRKLKDFFNKG